MSLQPEKLPEVPEETARIAKSLFPKGNHTCGYVMNWVQSIRRAICETVSHKRTIGRTALAISVSQHYAIYGELYRPSGSGGNENPYRLEIYVEFGID